MGNECCYSEDRNQQDDSKLETQQDVIDKMQSQLKSLNEKLKNMEQEPGYRKQKFQKSRVTAGTVRFSSISGIEPETKETMMCLEHSTEYSKRETFDSITQVNNLVKNQDDAKIKWQKQQLKRQQYINEQSNKANFLIDDDTLSLNQASMLSPAGHHSRQNSQGTKDFYVQTAQKDQVLKNSTRGSIPLSDNFKPMLSTRRYKQIDEMSNDSYIVSGRDTGRRKTQQRGTEYSIPESLNDSDGSQDSQDFSFAEPKPTEAKPKYNFPLPLDQLPQNPAESQNSEEQVEFSAVSQNFDQNQIVQGSASPCSHTLDDQNEKVSGVQEKLCKSNDDNSVSIRKSADITVFSDENKNESNGLIKNMKGIQQENGVTLIEKLENNHPEIQVE